MNPQSARVLLTGASGGIGQAMVNTLRNAGAQALGVSRHPRPDEPGLQWIQADLEKPDSVAHIAKAAASWRSNVLVHAAGLPSFGSVENQSAEQMQSVLHANLLAPMLLTQAMLPQLMAREKSQVIFVGSALGRIGLPGFSVYTASKAGLHGFAEALRRELADSPVVIQLLAPRSTQTNFNGSAAEAYNLATGASSDTPERVAQALIELIKTEAAERYIGWPERLAVRLNGAFPALLDTSFKKHRRQLKAMSPTPRGDIAS